MSESGDSGQVYEFGEFRLLVDERLLTHGSERIPLTPKVFDLLLKLVSNPGKLLEKERLMDEIWSDAIVEEGNLNRTISRLRNILGEKKNENRFIETVPRMGYRFVADVRRSNGEEIVEIHAEKNSSSSQREKKPHFMIFAAAAVVVIGILAAGTYYFLTRASAASSEIKTVAVLPFKPLNDSEESRVLAVGLADSLITKIGALRLLVVRPTSVVASLDDATLADPMAAGRKLNADAVIEGTILRADGRLRVNIRMIDVRTGEQIWSDRFDGAFTDVFQVEDTISEQAARALLPTISGKPGERLTRRFTEDPVAFDAYIRGRYFWNKRTEEGFRSAIESFQKAVQADPNYALAYAGLADSYILLAVWGTEPPASLMEKAKEAANRSIAANGELAEGRTASAFIKWVYDWDIPAAGEEFKKASELNPYYATAHHWNAYYLVSNGSSDAAIAEIRKAQELEGPLSPAIMTDIGEIYLWAGQVDRSIEHLRQAVDAEPGYAVAHYVLGMALIKSERYKDAVIELEKANSLESSPRIMAALSCAYSADKNEIAAREVIAKLNSLAATRYVSPFSLAIAYEGVGEREKALSEIEKLIKERSDAVAILRSHPLLNKLRADQQFQSMIAKAGI